MKRNTVNIENVKRLIAADYPLVEDFRCVEIMIPDDPEYLQVLAGFVALLGQNYAWTGTSDDRQSRSQLWREAYALTDWEQCMSCEDVADCIENNEAVQDALEDNLIDNIQNNIDVQNALNDVYNQYGVNPMPPAVTGANLIPVATGCDQDKIWGAIVVLIDSMHQNNIDAFEAAEEATDLAERAALLISAVPIFETLPVDEFVDYVQGIWTDDLFEAYNANDTTAYRDTLKCDLFCIAAANNCLLSIDDVYDYFLSRISADPSHDLIQLIAYLAAGTWTGTQVNDMFFAGQILLMKYGNQFFGNIGIRPFQTYMEIGSRSPSSDWELLCEVCDWEEITDVSTGENVDKWTIDLGTLEPGLYFQNALESFYPPSNTYQGLNLDRTVPLMCRLTYVKIEGTYTPGTLDSTGDSTFGFVWGSFTVDEIIPDTPTMPVEMPGLNEAGGNVSIGFICGVSANSPTDPGGIVRITKITLQGTGALP